MIRFQRSMQRNLSMAQMPEIAVALSNYMRSNAVEIGDGETVELGLRRDSNGLLEATAAGEGGGETVAVLRPADGKIVYCDLLLNGANRRFLLAPDLLP
jgi:hypothetical protein